MVLGADGDLWTSTAGGWIQRTAALTPPLDFAAMAFDPTIGAPVLLGMDGILWSWDGSGWRQLFMLPQGPTLCQSSYMGYDAAHAVLLAFGTAGCGGSGPHSETWTWDGRSWTRQLSSVSPPPRFDASMAYDAAHAEFVLFGGSTIDFPPQALADTWTWDGSTWTQRFPETSPPARANGSLASDDVAGTLVLFGGAGSSDVSGLSGSSPPTCSPCYLGDTWSWDGTNWTEQQPAHSPSARAGSAMVYDAATRSVLLFSGDSSTGYNLGFGQQAETGDTWTWNGTDWTELHPATSPTVRSGAGVAYDPARGAVVLYGGQGEQSPHDTWTWDGTNWTEATPAFSPSPSGSSRSRMAPRESIAA